MLYIHLHCKVFNLTSLWLFFHERGYISLAYPNFEDNSASSDVFKFGILILDIISGRKKVEFYMPPEQQILSQRVHINNLVASYIIFKITLDLKTTFIGVTINLDCVLRYLTNHIQTTDKAWMVYEFW